jgi:hypothetical protein
MSQSLIISNVISFDHHFKPCNLGWYVSVLILYVFSILKLVCTWIEFKKEREKKEEDGYVIFQTVLIHFAVIAI